MVMIFMIKVIILEIIVIKIIIIKIATRLGPSQFKLNHSHSSSSDNHDDDDCDDQYNHKDYPNFYQTVAVTEENLC